METISDSPTGSMELFATCQLGNHLLAARRDRAIYGTREERGIAVTPPGAAVGSSPSAEGTVGHSISSAHAPRGAPAPKTPKIPMDLFFGYLAYFRGLFFVCLFGGNFFF